MKNIIIVGTGAVAAELTSYMDDYKDISIKGYIDYNENIERYWKAYKLEMPVLGDINSYSFSGDEFFVIGISDLTFRSKMIKIIKEKGGNFLNIIHPSVIISKTAVIGEGNIIQPYCIIGPNVKIGNFNLLTSQTIVSHNSELGNNNFLATAILCGHVKVKDDNYFGIRSTVLPKINIGFSNKIQAGMIVDKNIKDNSTIFYRYKEQILALPKEHQDE
jgi:sugar O-acyltransferase (sialic acid O-acetyltransferase NeuD family)